MDTGQTLLRNVEQLEDPTALNITLSYGSLQWHAEIQVQTIANTGSSCLMRPYSPGHTMVGLADGTVAWPLQDSATGAIDIRLLNGDGGELGSP